MSADLMPYIERIETQSALRALLDDLNNAGIGYQVAGVDAAHAPFIVALSGPYAEKEVVIFGNPWDPEVDWVTGPRCEECANLSTMDALRFPVTVLKPHPDTWRDF